MVTAGPQRRWHANKTPVMVVVSGESKRFPRAEHAIIVLMIAYLLFTKDSPQEREIEYLNKRLEQLQVTTKVLEADSVEGSALTENYDLPQRPAVIVTRDDGSFVQGWQGELPTAEDISYFAHQ